MKNLLIKILKKPLDMIGLKIQTQPTLSNILINYFILFFALSILALVVFSYFSTPIILQLYLSAFFGIVFLLASVAGLVWSFKSYKYSDKYFYYSLGLFLIIGACSFVVTSDFIYDDFGFKRETIETKLTPYVNTSRARRAYCESTVRAQIDNKIYNFGCSDPSVEILISQPLDENSSYRLIILPNSQYILKAEKISTTSEITP